MTIKFKKSSVLFLLFFAAIMSVQAQEMSVKSFEYLATDLTARTNPKFDINDNPAAVIRVGIALQGVVFEGHVLGEPVYNTGEYLVYMSAGSRKLTVHHPNFLPLEVTFADYGIKQLEGRSTYRLSILTSTPNPPDPQPTGNFLVLYVNPTTARVTIDDQEPRKVKDGSFTCFLLQGSHNVTVEADDFQPQTVMVNMGSTRQQMDINLVSSLSTLIVKTGTAGAQIYIDEELKGTDQWQGLLAAGTYMVESRKKGYRSASLMVTLNQKQTETVTLPPLEKIYGALYVDVEPIDAEIYLDGKLLGKAPNLFNDVPIGKHRVRISKPGYVDRIDDVEIFENKQTRISGSLQREDGTLVSFTVKGVTFKMVKVEGGTFTMGATAEQGDDADDWERPVHQVTLSDYYIGQTEVTQALWTAVMGKNPSYFKGDNLPVDKVSWKDCQTFIEKLNRLLSKELGGKRFALPTEAQWEFAARGGNKSKGYKYAGSNNIDDVAWYKDNSGGMLHPVAQKKPNELGLYDMSGNVWEWCQDWYALYSSNAQTNPQGPASGSYRMNLGGGWGNSAIYCRVSYRSSGKPDYHWFDLGFRLCLIP